MESDFKLTTNLLVAAPAQAVSEKRRKKLSGMLADLDAVSEGHLAQVMQFTAPATDELVLFIVVEDAQTIASIRPIIQRRLKKILRFRETLETRFITLENEMLESIREAGCVIGWRD